MQELKTVVEGLELLKPDVARDAPVSVEWLKGKNGRETLRLMGNTEANNKPSTLEQEQKRVQAFLDSDVQKTWAICLHGQLIGSVWIGLEPTQYLPAPAIHLMLGDPTSRRKGYGFVVLSAVIRHLTAKTDYKTLYSRYLVGNEAVAALLRNLSFSALDKPYKDTDGLEWQNIALKLSRE